MLVRRSQMNWPDNSQGLVFPNSLGHIWQRGYATKELRRVLDPAGLSWVTFHTFRKTVATRLDEAGLTTREIADQLGHEQPSMTTDVYMGRKVVSEKVIDPLSW
ncbi:tyrosine-type recombinase/integrase [Corynebacterium striatum]|uniref:tyrosine-type recombinase/integrase n=1 Tax=Corynebacterium striatum TaxID=43770 RepID=UPI00254C405D|nr:tyrosine-type recombinase/integrase [Corynebacterium striatum]MDK8787807.1 tyrosine-type recombinase/integrase [Corynebacterium striatum]MDK8880766.1 tyrosine-type recombinase/integrase [Corynebacterium striatum]